MSASLAPSLHLFRLSCSCKGAGYWGQNEEAVQLNSLESKHTDCLSPPPSPQALRVYPPDGSKFAVEYDFDLILT